MKWAIGRLQAGIADSGHTDQTDVLVVDEIGPLELERGSGFVAVLEPLADPDRVPRGLVVVRRQYVEALERLIDRPDVRRFWVDIARREGLPAEIATALA
jgi:nucleoside-triphosphatase THEP1